MELALARSVFCPVRARPVAVVSRYFYPIAPAAAMSATWAVSVTLESCQFWVPILFT